MPSFANLTPEQSEKWVKTLKKRRGQIDRILNQLEIERLKSVLPVKALVLVSQPNASEDSKSSKRIFAHLKVAAIEKLIEATLKRIVRLEKMAHPGSGASEGERRNAESLLQGEKSRLSELYEELEIRNIPFTRHDGKSYEKTQEGNRGSQDVKVDFSDIFRFFAMSILGFSFLMGGMLLAVAKIRQCFHALFPSDPLKVVSKLETKINRITEAALHSYSEDTKVFRAVLRLQFGIRDCFATLRKDLSSKKNSPVN